MSELATVRRALADDLPTLLAIERAAFATPWTEDQIRAELETASAEVLLLEDPPGVPSASAVSHLVIDEGELLRIAVLPAARGRGLGRRLLSAVLERLAARGATICHLEVSAGNLAARRLYRSAGFHAVGRRLAYYGDGCDAELLARELDRP